jgi:copper chaperone CopZ/uncharacterized membrane protein YphA (DoxX/SURF4 family)
MTCKGCVAKVKSELLKAGDITAAEVQLEAPQATITMQKHISLSVLQDVLNKAGNYHISEDNVVMHHTFDTTAKASFLKTYKPLLLIGGYIVVTTLMTEIISTQFDATRWMRHFMAGFFLVFSFFKMLDLKGFADSYASYDIIAKKWTGWGFVYAFTELALGIAFLINYNPVLTNAVTFVIMSISIIGVIQSLVNKRKIQCACLGIVFNLPMSAVTIIEDALMIAMSGIMLLMI